MTEKIVTHADLPLLRSLRDDYDGGDTPTAHDRVCAELLDRLIAAAKADQPPLPEGWVLWETPDREAHRVVWHSNGRLYVYSDLAIAVGDFNAVRDRLTPLRPTITEADLVTICNALVVAWSGPLTVNVVERAFAAAGIEVSES